MVDNFTLKITDLSRLTSNGLKSWLNDELINAKLRYDVSWYSTGITISHALFRLWWCSKWNTLDALDAHKQIFVFTTYYMERIQDGKGEEVARDWIQDVDLFTKDLLIIPVNIRCVFVFLFASIYLYLSFRDTHWFCMFVWHPNGIFHRTVMGKVKIYVCDSVGKMRQDYVKVLKEYLIALARFRKGYEMTEVMEDIFEVHHIQVCNMY